MFQRIRHFSNTLSTNWSGDPGARGAAKMAAGGVLVVEGLFGVVRSRSRGRSRKGGRQVGGILGGILGIVFGIVFINIGGFLQGTGIQDPVATTGEIIAAERAGTSGENNQQMYRARIAYEVDGVRYEFSTRGRQSWRPNVGAEVDVVYSAGDPQNAQRVGGVQDWGTWAFVGAGWLVLVTSVFSLLVSIALIVFGVWLFQQGRADRRLGGEERSFLGDLLAIADDVRAGKMDVSQTAAGMAGAAQGAGAPAPTAAPPRPAEPEGAAAPAGWMLDPDDATMLRWWDGQRFTELRRPRDHAGSGGA